MYDAALERYIPVLMAMARIYWDRENYPVVEKLFRQAAEFCSDHDTWKLNAAHVFFMEEKFKVHQYVEYVYIVCTVCIVSLHVRLYRCISPGDKRRMITLPTCWSPELREHFLLANFPWSSRSTSTPIPSTPPTHAHTSVPAPGWC